MENRLTKKPYNFNLITGYPNSETDCFNYYDGPKIFFEQDASGQLWFLYYADDNMLSEFILANPKLWNEDIGV